MRAPDAPRSRHSKMATARIGLAVPPLIFSGKPAKRKRPRPTTLVEVGEAFHVRDAALGAGAMGLEVQLALGRRAHRLDSEHADALVGEPMHRLECEAREVVHVAGRAEQALVRRHVDQHGILRPDLLAGFRRAPPPSPER